MGSNKLHDTIKEISFFLKDHPNHNVLNDWRLEDIESGSVQTKDLYEKITESYKKLNINIDSNKEWIILTIQLIDNFDWNNTLPVYNKYKLLRYKIFRKFVENKCHAEAAILYKTLFEEKTVLSKDEKNQKASYQKVIRNYLHRLENKNNFSEALFVNSIYNLFPDYIFESNIEEKENKFIRMPFMEIVLEIVLPLFLLVFIIIINSFANKEQSLIYFIKEGNFSFINLALGFFIIYLTFWIFKLLDYSDIRGRLTILYKTIWVGILIGVLIVFVHHFYQQKYEKYFCKCNSIQERKGVTKILVTRLNPLEEHNIFDQGYSEINVSSLFYKKMLSYNLKENGKQETEIQIDFYPYNLEINERGGYDSVFTNDCYDAIVYGDILKRNEELVVFNFLAISNRNMYKNFNRRRLVSNDLSSFMAFYSTPFNYYQTLFDSSDITEALCIQFGSTEGLDLRYNIEIPNISFYSSLDNSPKISYNYVKFLHLWNKYENQKIIVKKEEIINEILSTIDKMIIQNDFSIKDLDENEKVKKNIRLSMDFLIKKGYFINEQIICHIHKSQINNKQTNKNELLDLWIKKVEVIRQAIKMLAKYNRMDDFKIDYLDVSFLYTNYVMLGELFKEGADLSDDNIDKTTDNDRNYYSLHTRYNLINELNVYEKKYKLKKYKTVNDSIMCFNCFRMSRKIRKEYIEDYYKKVLEPNEKAYKFNF